MGLYNYLFGPSEAELAQQRAAARRAAQRAAAQRAAAQRDAQARLCQSPTQRSGTLPCGLPIKVNPCDLKDLKLTERKVGKGHAPWVGNETPPKERFLPQAFVIHSRGTKTASPYVTGTIIEVTAGSPRDTRKTYLDIVIEEDYQFCGEFTHPHLVLTDPLGKATTFKGKKTHALAVFRKVRAADDAKIGWVKVGSFIDIWPVRWGFQDYRISALVCGGRKVGAAVRSQHTVIRAYPDDQWELSISSPSFFSASIKHGINTAGGGRVVTTTGSASVALRRTTATATATRTNTNGTVEWKGTAENKPVGPRAPGTMGPDDKGSTDIETRVKVELKRNDVKVMGLDWILTAINTFRNIAAAITAVNEAIKKYKPKVGWDWAFGVEVLTGSLKATWGFKESLDNRVFFGYSIAVRLVLVKLTFSVGFGVDMTIKGYGFQAGIEGKIDGSLTVSQDLERKSIKEAEWKHARFKSDIPASLYAKGMLIHDRVLSLKAGVETGFETDGNVGFDQQGLGIMVSKIEFKGITLKGKAVVVSFIDADVDYMVMQKTKIGGPLRFPG